MPGQTCEANLLFDTTLDVDEMALPELLAQARAADAAEMTELATGVPGFRMFQVGTAQMLVAGCAQPLDVTHFLDAARPGGTTTPDGAVLARLTAHRFSLTLLAAADPGAEAAAPACWALAGELCRQHSASLVFWCANDTLYAAEEFAEAGTYDASVADAPQLGVHRLGRQQILAAKAMTYMQGQIVDGAHKQPLRTRSRALSRSLKAMAAEPLDIARRYSRRLMSGASPSGTG